MEPIIINPRDLEERSFLLELIRRLGIHAKPYPDNLDEDTLHALVEEAGVAGMEQKQVLSGVQYKKRIDELITEIEKLDNADRLTVISRVLALLKGDVQPREESLPITSLRGLGKELWQNTNADSYIENERKSWGS